MADFSSPMREKIIAAYGEGMLRKSVISIRGGAGVLTELLCAGKYKTVLEIGTYRGVGAAEMSQYVERVVTIDLVRGKLELNRERHDRAEFWRSLGIGNIEFLAVRDDTHKALIVNALDFDFALVDGAHDSTVAKDFALVRRCGAVLFHDYDARGRVDQDYVINFVNTLPADELRPMDIFCFWKSGGHG